MGIVTDEVFDKSRPFPIGEYEACTFKSHDLGEGDLGGYLFVDCVFENCNLSMVSLSGTGLRQVSFSGCKMLGLRFDECKPFGLSIAFEGCQLNHSSFFGLSLKSTPFRNCVMYETDFSRCDLSGAVFDGCDMDRAVFSGTNLQGADFRTAFNYAIDPESNALRKARFSVYGLSGLLGKYGIRIENK